MKKVSKTIIVMIVLGLLSSNTFILSPLAAPNMDGWRWVGKPIYLQGNTKFTNAADISGSNIMSRIRSSYSYNSRRTKVLNVDWMQEKMYGDNNGSNYHYANITYDTVPNNGYGYTEWYDSPQGIFLDYVSQFILGKITDTSHGNQNPITDSIYYNRIQYPGTQQIAFLGSTQISGDLSDSKSAAILNRRGKTNYPIYLNNGKDLDASVKTELNSKNIRNLWVLGGSERFNATAGLGSNFNIIRVGGVNRNETLEFMKNSPEKLKLPSRHDGDGNGIVIKGNLGWLNSSVYNKLLSAKNNRNVNDIISAATDIFNNMNVGSKPSPNQDPSVVIGVNVNGWESYISIYYSQQGGAYVYQFILPGYFDAYKPINNWVDISEVDYINGNDYWVRPGKNFNVYTESRMNSKPYDLYPNATEALMESTDNGYSLSRHGLKPTSNGLYIEGDFNNNFNVVSGERAYNWQRNDSGTINNYISGTHVMSAKYDNRNYKVYSSGYYIGFNSWIGNTPYQNGKWIRTDGTAPTITFSSDRVENVWTKDDIKINISASDKRSGVDYTKLSQNKDNQGWTDKGSATSLTLNVTGKYDVKFETADKVGNSASVTKKYLIDKVNPVGNVEIKNVTPTGFDIVVKDMSDQHSGLSKVTLCTWTTAWDKDGKWQEQNVSNGTKSVTFRVNTSEYNNKSGKYIFDIRVFDVAGNERYSNHNIAVPDPLAIQGDIIPNPAKQGKTVTISLKTLGYANNVKIKFPDELIKLADQENPLTTDKNIKVESVHMENINFLIPLGTPLTIDDSGNRLREAYKIYIEATNEQGKKVSDFLYLDVKGNVMENLKIRFRTSGYDD